MTLVVPFDFATVRSATGASTLTLAWPTSFAGTGSVVALDAVAAFTIGSGPLYGDGTDNVAVIVALAPGARIGTVQGNAAHAPVIVPKASPAGGGSVMTTSVAVEGPALVTSIVKVAVLPAVTMKGVADLATWTSADGVIVVESLAVSSPGVGSVVPAGGVTLAVLASVPVASGATVPVAVNV